MLCRLSVAVARLQNAALSASQRACAPRAGGGVLSQRARAPCVGGAAPPDASGCPAAALMSDVYEDHKDEDGFLYITYSGENTFGC